MDFIQMTNYCEGKGYDIDIIRSKKGITIDLYKNKELIKIGTNVYNTCIDAQSEVFTKLYLMISK